MGTFSLEAISGVSAALSERGIVNNGSVSDVESKCADLFVEIMSSIASAAAVDAEFAEEISPDLSKLRTLLAKLPHPEVLAPPDELFEDELPYPIILEKAGFRDVNVDFITVTEYAPDNASVPKETALEQINCN